MKNIFLIALFLFSYSISAISQEISKVLDVANNIDYNEFNKNLEFLASDNLLGRETGSVGYAKAADYVADKFKENGLLPFGDEHGYFQKVPLIKRSIDKTSIDIKVKSGDDEVIASYGENISVLVNAKQQEIRESQEMVFVGYGIIDSALNINDYEGLDVKGKTVIIVMGSPKSMKDYQQWDPFSKVRNAISSGASGIILFFPQNLIQKMIFKQLHSFLGEPMVSLRDTSFKDEMFDFDLKVAAIARKDLIKDVFKLNNLNLNKALKKISKGKNSGQYLTGNLVYNYNINNENIDCKNVVGIIPGTDSILSKEYVIVGAHLDHVGIGEAAKGDSICNGMWDNATGSAAILSIAKTYKDAHIQPERSLVFVCYTGEEKGLLGSSYYASKNNMSDGKMIANLNIDMLGGLFPTKDIIPMGYSHSSLSEAIDFAASKLNFSIDDNKQEEDNYLFRSDQASYLRFGVPVLNVANGYTAVDPKINGQKEIDKWMKNLYHSPLDDLNQEYSKEAFLQALKLQFLTAYYITNELNEIKWKEDSWIYKKYVLKEIVD
jgi:hypothetical protein